MGMLARVALLLFNFVYSEEVAKTKVHIGIDLGTTFSCVTYHEVGSMEFPQLLFDGEATIPSTVYVESEKRGGVPVVHYGHKANAENKKNPSNTNFFYGFKRAMGLLQNDPVMKRFRENVTYPVDTEGVGANAIPIFNAIHSDKSKSTYTPTALSTLILGKMHAEITKNFEIISTVVTTPAYFSVNQDTQTRLAAENAGFKNVVIFKEPTAACIEYAQRNSIELNKEEKVLVFDLGGGTFDISIVEVENEKEGTANNGIFSNVSVTKYAGDNFLGGENINSAISEHFMKQIGVKLSRNEELRLRLFVEELKIKACNMQMEDPKAVASGVWFDANNNEYSFSLDKVTFDKLASKVYDRIKDLFYSPSEGLFRKVNTGGLDKAIDKAEIQKVILVGGSTKIPYIREWLKKEFPRAVLSYDVDPDKSVSLGACRFSANADGEQSVMLLNATTLPIGIAVSDGSFQPILEKDITIPTTASSIFSTVEDNQTRISLAVYTGVRPLARQNTLLGTFELELQDPRPRGVPRIEVKVEMDRHYNFNVIATDLDTKVTNKHAFTENYIGTDKAKVQEILNAAKEHEAADAELKNKLEQTRLFKSALEMYNEQLKKSSDRLSEDDSLMFKSIYETYNTWINEITESTLASEITAELEAFQAEAEKLAQAIQSAPQKEEKGKEEEKAKEAKEEL